MPVLVYTLLRAAIFLTATGLLWWAGMRSWLAPVVAAVVAWAVSYVVLPRQREAATAHLAARAERRGSHGASRAEQDAAAEDAATDASATGTSTTDASPTGTSTTDTVR